MKCKNFIKQLEKEFAHNIKLTKKKLKMLKNNKNSDTSFYMIVDKK